MFAYIEKNVLSFVKDIIQLYFINNTLITFIYILILCLITFTLHLNRYTDSDEVPLCSSAAMSTEGSRFTEKPPPAYNVGNAVTLDSLPALPAQQQIDISQYQPVQAQLHQSIKDGQVLPQVYTTVQQQDCGVYDMM